MLLEKTKLPTVRTAGEYPELDEGEVATPEAVLLHFILMVPL